MIIQQMFVYTPKLIKKGNIKSQEACYDEIVEQLCSNTGNIFTYQMRTSCNLVALLIYIFLINIGRFFFVFEKKILIFLSFTVSPSYFINIFKYVQYSQTFLFSKIQNFQKFFSSAKWYYTTAKTSTINFTRHDKRKLLD